MPGPTVATPVAEPQNQPQQTTPNPEPTPSPQYGDDVLRMLEKVRQEEKKKLYPKMKMQEDEIARLQQEKEALLKAVQASEDDDKKNKKQLSESELIRKELEENRKQVAELLTQQKLMKEEADKQIAQSTLRAYRAEQLRVAGVDIIPELVGGYSEAEIDASIIASKQRYAQIKEAARAQFKGQQQQVQVPGPNNNPPPPGNQQPGEPGVEALTARMIDEMSPEEWEKERLNIRSQVDGQMKQFFRGGH